MRKLSQFKILNPSSGFDYYSKVSFQNKYTNPLTISFLQKTGIILFYLHPHHWIYIIKHLARLRGIRKLLNKMARFF